MCRYYGADYAVKVLLISNKRANESLPTFIEFIYSINLKNLTR